MSASTLAAIFSPEAPRASTLRTEGSHPATALKRSCSASRASMRRPCTPIPRKPRPSRTPLPGSAHRHGRGIDLDALAGIGEPLALDAEHGDLLLHHVLHQQPLAVAREGGPLRPGADRRLGEAREAVAV